MPVIPINDDYSNISNFIDSLFDKDVRSLDNIKSAIFQGKTLVTFSDEGEKILQVWMEAWQFANNLPYNRDELVHCPTSDKELLTFLSHFIFNNNLCIQLPNLSYQGLEQDSELPIYQLNGYQRLDFIQDKQWQMDTVKTFLELLMLGAHFVFIQAAVDLPPNVDVESYYELFRNSSDLSPYRRRDPSNSHYTSLINVCGYYVPIISSNKAPNICPFLLAYLVGITVSLINCQPEIYSTFMQLEGWQTILPSNTRHNADFEIHKKTLWNISTFGACVYSEKRGTTIFLAPTAWKPKPNPDTIMPPYAGAETRQKWLNANLICLQS